MLPRWDCNNQDTYANIIMVTLIFRVLFSSLQRVKEERMIVAQPGYYLSHRQIKILVAQTSSNFLPILRVDCIPVQAIKIRIDISIINHRPQTLKDAQLS